MRKLLALAVLLLVGPARAQVYEPDGALRTMDETHYWDGSAWQKWTGLVTGDWLTDAQLRATPVPVSGSGTFDVNCLSGCGGASPFADGSAFTFGTTPVGLMGAVVDDTATNTVAENSAGAPRMNTNRILYFNPRNNAGTEIGTAGSPFRVDPTGTTSQPVTSTQLPAALVGGRLDTNMGAWLGSTAPTVGQKAAASSLPVVPASDYVPGRRTVSGTLTATTLNDAVTISAEGASSIVFYLGTGLVGGVVITFEATDDGTIWFSTPFTNLGTGNPQTVEQTTIGPGAGGGFAYQARQPGHASYRMRISTVGSSGTASVTAIASEAKQSLPSLLPWGQQTILGFDLNLPGNIQQFTLQGLSAIAFQFGSSLGGATVVSEASVEGTTWVSVPCYPHGDASIYSRDSFTGSLTTQSFVFVNSGYQYFRLRVTVTTGSTTAIRVATSTQSTLPEPIRDAAQWTIGSSPTSVAGTHQPAALYTPEGQLAVTSDHPRSFTCAFTSTATTSTVVGGCFGSVTTLAAPGAGLRFYITSYSWASSIISTTTNFMTLQYGTGATCGTGTTPFHRGFALAFTTVVPDIGEVPIRIAQNNAVCFVHPGAGTRLVNIRGYVAP